MTTLDGIFTGGFANLNLDLNIWMPVLDGDLMAVQSSINSALSAQTTQQATMTQGKADAATLEAPTKEALATSAALNGGINRVSSGCLTTKMRQAAAGIRYGSRSAARAIAGVMSQANTGPNSDSTSPAVQGEAVSDRCKIGFIDPSGNGEFGKLGQTLGCKPPPDPSYVDADTRLSSVLDPLEYPVPDASHWQQLPDGDTSFVGKNGTVVSDTVTNNLTGIGSELDFAAAWKYCEHLRPLLPTPPHDSGNRVTPVALVRMSHYTDTLARSTGALEMCFKAIAYRTRCPSGGGQSGLDLLNNGNGQSCADAQKAICTRLTSKPPIGYGLTFQSQDANSNSVPNGNEYSNILIGCQQGQGISMAAYDAIMAHKCGDDTFVQNMKTRLGSDAAVEHAVNFECKKEENFHDELLQEESQNLQKAIRNLELLRNTISAATPASARIAQ